MEGRGGMGCIREGEYTCSARSSVQGETGNACADKWGRVSLLWDAGG